MGLEFHITRRTDWSQDGPEISLDEWRAMVVADPELEPDAANADGYVIWKRGRNEGLLYWFNGNVDTKNPDELLFEKMLAVAKRLGAQVQDDDGEVYTDGGSL